MELDLRRQNNLRKLFSALIVLTLVSSQASWAVSSPLNKATGARPLSLGSAYAGLSNDAAGLFVNPAGLTSIKRVNFTSMYTQPVSDTTFTALGSAFPALGGVMGAGFRNRTLSNVQASAEVVNFSDQEILLSYSRQIRANFSLAVGFRSITKGLSRTVAGFEGLNGSGSSYDLGLKWNVRPGYDIGLVYQNLGGQINYKDDTKETLSSNLILGNTFSGGKNVLVNIDLSQTAEEPILFHVGTELRPREFFAVRLGFDQTARSKTAAYTHFTGGLGILVSGVTLDYAFYKQGDPTGTLSHYFSLGYIGQEKPTVAKKEKAKTVKPADLIRKVKLLQFKDITLGDPRKEAIEKLCSAGIIDYFPDNTFKPDRNVSRAELVSIIVRPRNYALPKIEREIFKDVPTDFWAANYIQLAYDNKIVRGFPDGTFKPRKAVTRILLYRVFSKFPEMQMAQKPLDPKAKITRGELAQALWRTPFIQARIKQYEFIK